MTTLYLPANVACEVLRVTGEAVSRIDVCPIVAGSSRISSFQLYLGSERVRHVDAFSPLGVNLRQQLEESHLIRS